MSDGSNLKVLRDFNDLNDLTPPQLLITNY